MSWDPEIYLRYEADRTRPARDLLDRVPLDEARRVYDLGCGPGNSTRVLATRFPMARLTGLDSSKEMLAKARQNGPTGAAWLDADLAHWRPDDAPCLLFANATFQWVPEPERVLPALLARLRPGGVLAFQVPANFDQPSHRAITKSLQAIGAGAVEPQIQGPRFTRSAVDYYRMLKGVAAGLDIWDSDYLHILDGADPVLAWVMGTALRPVLAALPGSLKDDFLAAYAECLRSYYPREADGRTPFSFQRRFVIAVRS